MKTYEETSAFLDAPIPRDAISKRAAGFGSKKLDYLEGWYVIDRLNKAFGNGRWGYTIPDGYPKVVHEAQIDGKYRVSYLCKISLDVPSLNQADKDSSYRGFGVNIEEIGYGNGMDAKDPGKSHELASKEAVTDALKRAAKSLGMSMGLALYDKTQENVTDGRTKAAADVGSKVTPRSTGGGGGTTVKDLAGLIRSTARVAVAKRAITAEAAKEYIPKEFGVATADLLTKAQAEKCLAHFKTLTV